jgi:hypothetical protein
MANPNPRPGGDLEPHMIKLIVTPEANPQKAGRFTARLEGTGEVVIRNSRQPLADGARELLTRGFDPATLLTMRLEGRAYDSFRPMPIGHWAKVTYTESEEHPLRRQRWMPRPADREGQKSGVEPSAGTPGHPKVNSLLRAPVADAGMPPRFGADQPS